MEHRLNLPDRDRTPEIKNRAFYRIEQSDRASGASRALQQRARQRDSVEGHKAYYRIEKGQEA